MHKDIPVNERVEYIAVVHVNVASENHGAVRVSKEIHIVVHVLWFAGE